MFKTEGVLDLGVEIKNSSERDREALLYFSKLVNPRGLAFHPKFIADEIPEISQFPKDFVARKNYVQQLVGISRKKALAKHLENNPKGVSPNEVLFKDTAKKQYTLSWCSAGLEIIYVMTVTNNSVSLRVIGRFEVMVKRISQMHNLPKPRKMSKDRMWHAIKMTETKNNEQLSFALKQFGDVLIPVGDFLDFVAKYRQTV